MKYVWCLTGNHHEDPRKGLNVEVDNLVCDMDLAHGFNGFFIILAYAHMLRIPGSTGWRFPGFQRYPGDIDPATRSYGNVLYAHLGCPPVAEMREWNTANQERITARVLPLPPWEETREELIQFVDARFRAWAANEMETRRRLALHPEDTTPWVGRIALKVVYGRNITCEGEDAPRPVRVVIGFTNPQWAVSLRANKSPRWNEWIEWDHNSASNKQDLLMELQDAQGLPWGRATFKLAFREKDQFHVLSLQRKDGKAPRQIGFRVMYIPSPATTTAWRLDEPDGTVEFLGMRYSSTASEDASGGVSDRRPLGGGEGSSLKVMATGGTREAAGSSAEQPAAGEDGSILGQGGQERESTPAPQEAAGSSAEQPAAGEDAANAQGQGGQGGQGGENVTAPHAPLGSLAKLPAAAAVPARELVQGGEGGEGRTAIPAAAVNSAKQWPAAEEGATVSVHGLQEPKQTMPTEHEEYDMATREDEAAKGERKAILLQLPLPESSTDAELVVKGVSEGLQPAEEAAMKSNEDDETSLAVTSASSGLGVLAQPPEESTHNSDGDEEEDAQDTKDVEMKDASKERRRGVLSTARGCRRLRRKVGLEDGRHL
eukprot:GHVU01014998.1.p1 GENE.GHVU01014998.1~~GHVU01014998.1.p1  ORF type:complete len:601 (-),score=110.81 GHVU01014998.1:418-2220(-)